MGADIHYMIERQRTDRHDNPLDVWDCVSEKYSTPVLPTSKEVSEKYPASALYGNRNYAFFAALAGVRGDGPDPRGVPDNLSPYSEYIIDQYAGDGHSHSWAPLKEFVLTWLKVSMPEVFAQLVANRLGSSDESQEARDIMRHYCGVDHYELDSYRVVYFFDN